MHCTVIRGVVVYEGSTPPDAGANLLVRIGTVKSTRFESIGETRTDSDGKFMFDLGLLSGAHQAPEFYELRVYESPWGERLTTHGTTRWRPKVHPGPLVICAEEPTACAEPDEQLPGGIPAGTDDIYGLVRHYDGYALSGLVVKVFSVTVTGELEEDDTTTDTNGWYQFNALTLGSTFNAVIRVYDSGTSALLGSSRVVWGVATQTRIDVEVYDENCTQPAEFVRLDTDMDANRGATNPKDVDIAGIAMLSGITGWDVDRVSLWVLAFRMSDAISGGSGDEERLYGLLRMGFPRTLETLLSRPMSTIQPALDRAVFFHYIDPTAAGTSAVNTFIATLQAALEALMKDGSRDDSLYAILSTTQSTNNLSTAEKDTIVEQWVGHTGTDAAFWDLSAIQTLGGTAISRAKLRITLGTLALSYAPLVQAIFTQIGSGEASDTATLDATAWATVVNDAYTASGLPEGVPGGDLTTQKNNLAIMLEEHAELMFPNERTMPLLASDLAAGPLKSFVSNYPDFDLATGRVETATSDPDEQAAGRTVQRLYRVAPSTGRAEAIVALDNADYTSAHSVARKGRARFVAQLGGAVGVDVAETIYRKAKALEAVSATFLTQAHPTFSRSQLRFVPHDPSFDHTTLTEWDSLFASAQACGCEHCLSVLSPSAYLVDLLQWLDAREQAGTTDTLLDALVDRRPDIPHIELSCENTLRALPYIDLALEILEAVTDDALNSTTNFGTDVPQTEASTAAMLASPQHRMESVYTSLASLHNSFKLPFHRPLVEARAFLAHLGVPRFELLRAFQGSSDLPTALSDDDRDLETLGLFTASLEAITHYNSSDEADYWPTTIAALAGVKALRWAAEISWPEVLDLLHSRYANVLRGGSPSADPLEVTATDWGDLDTYTLVYETAATAPDAAALGPIRQMVRLSRVTGWSILELDKVLTALGVTDLTASASAVPSWVGELANLKRLEALTGMDAVELAQTQATLMDTWEDRESQEDPTLSLYDQVYLSPTLLTDQETEHGFFQLSPSREELDYAGDPPVYGDLSDHTAHVAAALGMNQEGLAELISLEALSDLSLSALSTLYRWSVVCRAAKLSARDVVALVGQSMADLAPLSSLSDLVTLVELSQELAEADWSVDELRYVVLREREEQVGLTDEAVATILGKVRDAVRAELDALGDETSEASVRERVVQVLAEALGLEAADVDGLRGLSWDSSYDLASGTDFTAAEDITLSTTPGGTETATLPKWTELTLPSGAAYTPTGGSSANLAAATSAQLLEEKDASVLTSTTGAFTLPQGGAYTWDEGANEATIAASTELSYLGDVQLPAGTAVYIEGIGAATLDSVTSDVTLQSAASVTLANAITDAVTWSSEVSDPDLARRFLRDDFRALPGATPEQPYDDILADAETSPTFAQDFAVVRELHVVSLVLKHLALTPDERDWWYSADSYWSSNIAQANQLADTGSTDGFALLSELILLFAQRARLPGASEHGLTKILEAATSGGSVDDVVAAVTELTDWATEDFESDATADSAPATGTGFKELIDRARVARRLGSTSAAVAGWCVSPSSVDADASAAVVSAARSRYDEAAWGSVARPVRDVLRKAQRDALVATLIAKDGGATFERADDLYEHYLIDVSMNPEMLTSRVKQASLSVQLFIHRLMLGLELNGSDDPVFEPTMEDRQEWEWMRTYRVWEAARKVFIYPENWIEPELRDDKTPFFELMERELAQGDTDTDRVEECLLGYLDRMREVSTLEVLGYYIQREDVPGADDIDTLHVFARTREAPQSTWYRRLESDRLWTPWEEVKCGVTGSLVVPVVHNRRLMLFWGKVQEQASSGSNDTFFELSLSWSEYRDGAWSRERVSDSLRVDNSESGIMLLSRIDSDGNLAIDAVSRAYGSFEDGELNGTFTLNPCTLKLAVNSGSDEHQRVAAVGTMWLSPGYRTEADPNSAIPLSDELVLYVAEADDALEALPDVEPSEVLVLGDGTRMSVVVPSQVGDFVSQAPFFIQTPERAWFVRPGAPQIIDAQDSISKLSRFRNGTWVTSPNQGDPTAEATLSQLVSYLGETSYSEEGGLQILQRIDADHADMEKATRQGLASTTYDISPFYHPFTCTFVAAVRRAGPFALLDPDPQGPESALRRQAAIGEFDFNDLDPSDAVTGIPVEDIDFSPGGAMSIYNWELFFHLPLYLASRLADAGRHDDAMAWLHAIFDPRVSTAELESSDVDSARWWKVKPLMEAISQPVTDWIAFTGSSGDADAAAAYQALVEAWREDPFNPHLVARMRPGTYQKVVVMRYLENLIAWGDQLFTRDTMETVNEAIQLYVYAKRLLGDRPEQLESHSAHEAKTYDELATEGAFTETAAVLVENAYTAEVSSAASGHSAGGAGSSLGLTSYFCVPENAHMLSYWDTLDDRLYKVRNGMNIEGVVRSLPLFEPPIDPAMLVRAAAAGLDIGSVLDGLNVNLPHYRFQVLHGRAAALAGRLSALGGALLSALEKQSAEALAVLRSEQELALMDEIKALREQQIAEAQRNLEALQAGQQITQARHDYYDKLISEGWLASETAATVLALTATGLELGAGVARMIQSAIAAAGPEVHIGICAGTTVSGEQVSNVPGGVASVLQISASAARGTAAFLNTVASYKRREQEWKQQRKMAKKELAQLKKQLAAAQLRVEITEKELRNHELQAKNAAQVLDFMTRRFTNEALYAWMVSQLAALHYQAYQLALATAKKAEACYRHELGRSDSFIGALYWDGLRKGLLAGERLSQDLDRMDMAYLDNDRRELELTRHVSLNRLDPMALVRLRSEGECWFDLPEVLFDLDCPGHYKRRIISVGVTIACVSGAQGQVNAELTLHQSQVRNSASTAVSLDTDAATYPSIVTSRGANDAGLFQPDMRDPRYQPFERKGVISRWRLRFCNQDYAQFDWGSVSDVVMHVQYTARDGGAAFRSTVLAALAGDLDELSGGYSGAAMFNNTDGPMVGLSARRDEPDTLYQATSGTGSDEITLTLGDQRLPYFAVGKVSGLATVHVFLIGVTPAGNVSLYLPSTAGTATDTLANTEFTEWPGTGSGVRHGAFDASSVSSWPDDLKLKLASGTFVNCTDVLVILEYSVS